MWAWVVDCFALLARIESLSPPITTLESHQLNYKSRIWVSCWVVDCSPLYFASCRAAPYYHSVVRGSQGGVLVWGPKMGLKVGPGITVVFNWWLFPWASLSISLFSSLSYCRGKAERLFSLAGACSHLPALPLTQLFYAFTTACSVSCPWHGLS